MTMGMGAIEDIRPDISALFTLYPLSLWNRAPGRPQEFFNPRVIILAHFHTVPAQVPITQGSGGMFQQHPGVLHLTTTAYSRAWVAFPRVNPW